MIDQHTRHGRQLMLVIGQLRVHGKVYAHDMLTMHGISRMAHLIWLLRSNGWDIYTEPRQPGSMAVYTLQRQPDQWAIPVATRAPRGWRCAVCGSKPSVPVDEATTSIGKAECATCGKVRMFRRGA